MIAVGPRASIPRDAHPREESKIEGWLLDLGGMVLGFLVSAVIVFGVVDALLAQLAPSYRAALALPPGIAFAIGFIGFDYLHYWSHRLFHAPGLWRFHVLHHTVVRMNGLGALRHSLWECAFSPVFWAAGVLFWLLQEPSWFATAISTGFLLDIFRHSWLETYTSRGIGRLLGAVLVTPEDHAVHHRHPPVDANYGGNLKLWDQLHGTFRAPDDRTSRFGVVNADGPWHLLFGAASSTNSASDPTVQDVLQYGGLTVLLVWFSEVGLVLGMSLVLLDVTHPGSPAIEWLMGFGQDLLSFGALTAVGSTLIAIRLNVPTPKDERDSRHSVLLRDHGYAIASLLIVATIATAWLERSRLHLAVAPTVVIAYCILCAITLTLATRAMVRALRSLPDRMAVSSLATFAVGVLVFCVGRELVDLKPVVLQRWTVLAVDAVMRSLYPNATRDLAMHAVGTTTFRVRILPDCSGVEGMTLGAVMVAFYLAWARTRLRFPRALLLFPIVVVGLAATNVARLVALIVIGQRASQQALAAFHSSIGWFSVVVALTVLIPGTESVLRLRKPATEGIGRRRCANDAAPYLLPLAASLFVAVTVSMIDLGATHWALLRYLVAVGIIAWSLRESIRIDSVRHIAPWLAGAAVAAVYVSTLPPDISPSGLVTLTFGGSSAVWALLHFFGFALATPLVEELAFRGFLLRRLVSDAFLDVPYGDVNLWAILVSSIAFGLLHGAWIQGTIAGVVFGLCARHFGGVGGAFVAHAVANGILAGYAVTTGRLGVIG